MILVDRTTGKIAAPIRVITFSPEFTRALQEAIRAQAALPFPGAAAYDRQIDRLYSRYPTSDALLAACAHTCTAGTS